MQDQIDLERIMFILAGIMWLVVGIIEACLPLAAFGGLLFVIFFISIFGDLKRIMKNKSELGNKITRNMPENTTRLQTSMTTFSAINTSVHRKNAKRDIKCPVCN